MRTLLLFTFAALLCSKNIAQDIWPSQHVAKEFGLSNSSINYIFMDSRDHVWFGTWDGLNRYDGSNIDVYKPITNDTTSLSNNVIEKIFEDTNKNLWVVTNDGLNLYDREKDNFVRHLNRLESTSYQEYRLNTNNYTGSGLFASISGKGVFKFDPKLKSFVNYPIQGLEVNQDINYLESELDQLFIVTFAGDLIITKAGRVQTLRKGFIPTSVSFLDIVRLGNGLFLVYQTEPGEITLLKLNDKDLPTRKISIPGKKISSIAKRLNKISALIGTEDGGLYEMQMGIDGFEITDLTSKIPAVHSKSLKIFSLQETKQNILWVGTDGDGVYKFLTKPSAFNSITKGDLENAQISNGIVRAIHESKEGTLYVGTRSGGLNVINQETGKTTVYTTNNGLSDNTVLSIAEDTQGNIWLGLDNKGLNVIEKTTGNVFQYPNDFQLEVPPFSINAVYKIFFDSENNMWLGTSGDGVIKLSVSFNNSLRPIVQELEQITVSSEPGIQLRSDIVYSIIEDNTGFLWFGTRHGGLYRYNTATKSFTHHLKSFPAGKGSLSNDDILSLYLDLDSQLWVGTSGGLNSVSLQDYSVRKYTKQNETINNTIHGILEDEEGDLWLSTNNGLTRFDQDSSTFKTFDLHDGLANSEFTDGAYFKSKVNNKLLFGGTRGIDIVSLEKIIADDSFPKLVLQKFYISNELVQQNDSKGVLERHIDFQDSITLTYDQNFISFGFTSLDHWHKPRAQYRYFLENFEDNWNNIGTQSTINLTNIPPGDYTLFIDNSNENGDWNPSPRSIYITITPPFWATNLAYVVYILLAIGAQIGIFALLRARTKNRKNIEIEEIKKVQLAEINNYKLEFFTNIAHEFRTPLTMILGPAIALKEKLKKDPRVAKQLQSIYRNSIQLQKLIQELIQFRKVELGKEKLHLERVNITDFTNDILDSFYQFAQAKSISISVDIEDNLQLYPIDIRKIKKAMLNLISNALKYTNSGGKVLVKVWEDQSRLHFMVSDNGIGIRTMDLSKIFVRFNAIPKKEDINNLPSQSTGIGLSLTKRIIELHQGEINVTSDPTKGTQFEFWIPIDEEAYPTDLVEIDPLMSLKGYHELDIDLYDNIKVRNQKRVNLEQFEETILVVDDSVEILDLLEDLLSDRYNVISTTKPNEALGQVKSNHIDLVISDVIMPEKDGYQLCHEIKENISTSHIPVILLTAKGDEMERIEGLKAGADAYIPKPFHPDHLNVRIEKLLETRKRLQEKFSSESEGEFESFGIGPREDDFFNEVVSFIKENLENADLDAVKLGNHLGMSKTSLYNKLKALTGLTPNALVNQFRLKKAAFLLLNSGYNVSEVIYQTGFNSRSYFYKSFTELFGCSPSVYAKKN